MSDSLRHYGLYPARLLCPWDFPGKNTGVGCHFLFQCMKVESESEVTQSCLTLSNPMDAAYQAPPSMGFSGQQYWSGVPLPSPIKYYSAIKKNDFESVLVRWLNLEPVIQSEISQKERNTYHVLTYMYEIWGFPGGSDKESTCQCRRHRRRKFDPRVRKISGGEMATHSSILTWEIPWTEKPGRLKSVELQRVEHEWNPEKWYWWANMWGRWRYRLENGLVYSPPSFSTLAMAIKEKK